MLALQILRLGREAFILDGDSDCRKRARELASREDNPETRQEWLTLAEEASRNGDWLLSEYAYKKGLNLRVLW